MLSLLILLLTTTAHAEVKFECTSVKYSDQIAAYLSFALDGQSGRIEADYRNGFPPIGLVWADMKPVKSTAALTQFVSEKDRSSHYHAEMLLPVRFLKTRAFTASLAIHRNNAKKEVLNYEMNCESR